MNIKYLILHYIYLVKWKEINEIQHIDTTEIDNDLLDRMFDVERQKRDNEVK